MSNRPAPGTVEDRSRPTAGDVEQRAAPNAAPTMDGPRLRGLIPYGVESRDLGGWREVVEPGALANARTDDLVATVDHGGVPIARYPGTLTIEDRDDGLHWSLELPECRSDVREAVQRGDLASGSWRMIVARDEWRGSVRHIHEISELRDVSVVSSPAYSASVVEHRSHPDAPPAGPTPGPQQRRGLRVEDRTATSGQTVEARVMDAMRAVPQGESRDLVRATASPVEPAELSTFLWDRLRQAAVVLSTGIRVITTDRQSVKWPTLTGDVTAAWLNELEQIPESDPSFGTLEIVPKALKALVRGSSEAFEDSDPDLLRIVQDNVATTLGLRLDQELLVGNTAKGFPGLATLSGTQSIAVNGALTNYDPVVKALGMLAEARVPGPYVVLAHPRVLTALDLLKEADGSNAPLGRPEGLPQFYAAGQMPVTTGQSPATTVLVYAPAQVLMVRRRDVTVEVDRSREFETDAVLVRGKVRAALGTPHAEAIVKLTGVSAPAIA